MKKESFQGILLGIVIMCAVFAFITIAWAAFSDTLSIGGTATVKKQSWQIDFTDDKTKDFATAGGGSAINLAGNVASGTLAVADTSADRLRITDAHHVSGKIGVFNAGGDKITYTWYAKNFGTFDIDASVKTSNSSLIATNTLNYAGGNINLICYTSSGSVSSPDQNDWCNGTGSAAGNIKATLKVGRVSSTAVANQTSKWTLAANNDGGTNNDDDVLQFDLEIEFVNSAGSGANPTTSSSDITVDLGSIEIDAVQSSTSYTSS